MKAYAWKSRLIEFGRKTPEGAITIHTGPAKALRETVTDLAVHGQGQSDGKLLVPIPIKDLINNVPFNTEHLSAFADRVANSMARQIPSMTPTQRKSQGWIHVSLSLTCRSESLDESERKKLLAFMVAGDRSAYIEEIKASGKKLSGWVKAIPPQD